LLPGCGCACGQGALVVHRDVADSEGDLAVCAVADRSKVDVRNSGRFGSEVPVTCGPAPVRCGPWMPWSPHALPAPEYRPGLRVGSGPRSLEVIRDAFP